MPEVTPVRVIPHLALIPFALAASSCSPEAKSPDLTVEVYAMSKCAFSAKALTALIPVVKAFGGRATLQLDYVARHDGTRTTSPYGDDDLSGDRYQLCARDQGTTDSWLTFLSCQNADWEHVPTNVPVCAERAALDAGLLRECANGERGKELLRASLQRSERRNVSGTPTIFINGKGYQRGRTQDALARSLCAAIGGLRPAACDGLPEPVAVPVTIVGDGGCTADACGYRNFVRFLDFSLEGVEVLEVDSRSAAGRKMLASLGDPPTPFALFSTAIEKEREIFGSLQRAGMAQLPDGAGYAMVIRDQTAAQAQP